MTSLAVARLLVSHACAAIGMSLPWPLLLVLVWESTGDPVLLGVAGAARMAPYLLLSWAAGRLADRGARDRIVRLTLVGRIAALTLAAVAIAGDRVGSAVVAAAVAVALATPAYPALAAALPRAVPDRAERATGLLVTIEVASFVVGPALGGLLLAGPARPWVGPLAVVLTLVAVPLLAGVRLPAPERGSAAAGGVAAALRASPELRTAIATVAVVNLVLAAAAIALLPLAETGWRSDAAAYGIATGVLGFGALAGPLLARLGRTDTARAVMGLGLVAAGLGAVAVSTDWTMAAAPLALVGAAAVHVEAAATSAMQRHAPDGVRAAILGVADTAMVGAALVGALAAPPLAHRSGGGPLLLALAGLGLAWAWRLARPGASATGRLADPGVTTRAATVSRDRGSGPTAFPIAKEMSWPVRSASHPHHSPDRSPAS